MARRAVVAMSGGVDSSVVAALLKQRGYEVIGVTLNFRPCGFDTDSSGAKWCCGGDGNHRAKNAALHLGIRHYVLDCHKEFERAVLRHAWDEYSGGRTPSPCLSCNKDIKFGYLMDIARKQGAEILATGHYARITLEPSGAPVLLRGVDPAKDQSYFLFTLTNQQLAVASFPLGGMEKGEVRLLAREFGLPNADQPDSQDACFMSEEANFAESLRKRFGGEARPGEIVDISGRVLGKHSGIHNFTIGQRKGIGVFGGRKLYVSGIEHETARVVVSP
ncbi:MAG TPA: tRNA 2-thiouridine(34) synthase MnmA, partial [Nitrospirota bacterium]